MQRILIAGMFALVLLLSACGQGRGTVDGTAGQPPCGHAVDGGNVCRLQRGFIVQLGDGVVCHAVPDDEKVFHKGASLKIV